MSRPRESLGANARARLRLVGAAIAYRARPSVALFLLATAAALAAAVGPLYLLSADGSVLASALSSPPPVTTGLSLVPTFGTSPGPAQLAAVEKAVPAGPAGKKWYGSPILTDDDGGSVGQFSADMVSRTGECANLVIVAGHCPSSEGQVLLTQRSATDLGTRLGGTFVFEPYRRPDRTVHVSGIYLPGSSKAPYWWGIDYFVYGQENVAAKAARLPYLDVDAVFTTPATVAVTGGPRASELVQLVLEPSHVELGDVTPLQDSLAHYEQVVAPRLHFTAASSITAVLSQVSSEQSQMGTVVGVAALQLVVLALFVLYTVAGRTSEAREPELALAALRGLSGRSSVGLAMLEPLVLICAAMPAGFLLAWAAVGVAAPHVLPAAGPTGPTVLAAEAVAVAFLAAVVTFAVATRRQLRPSLAGDLRVSLAGSGHRSVNAIEGAVLAATIGALVEVFDQGSRAGAVTVFAPGLVALAGGLVARRAMPAVCRLGVRATTWSRNGGVFLAFRQLARRPAAWRQLIELTLAVGLAAFATSAWMVSSVGRSDQAVFLTGGSTVLTVAPVPPFTLEADVRAADPSGRVAMAAVDYSSATENMLAVDTSRFRAVAPWPSGVSPDSAARVVALLHPPEASPVYLYGRGVRIVAGTAGTPAGQPDLSVSLFDVASQSSANVDLGAITRGVHDYAASFGAICGRGCRLVNIGPIWPASVTAKGQPLAVALSLDQVQVQRPSGRWVDVPAGIGDPGKWQATSASITSGGGDPSLRCRFVLQPYSVSPTVQPADTPALLPALFTPQLAATDLTATSGDGTAIEDLDSGTVQARQVGMASALPEVGNDALLVDLSYAALQQRGQTTYTTDQVWLSTPDYLPVVQRLRVLGLHTLSVTSAGTVGHTESTGGNALAALFLLFAGGVALVLAAGTSLALVLVEARQRAAVLAALAATGVRARTLRRSLLLEQLLVLAAGTLVGTAAGGVAGWLALRAAPVVAQLAAGPPLTDPVPLGGLALTAVVVLAVLSATVAVGVLVSMRAARGQALRERPR